MMTRKATSPTQTERAFWREAFLTACTAFLNRRGTARSPDKLAALAATYADAALEQLRARVLWRRP